MTISDKKFAKSHFLSSFKNCFKISNKFRFWDFYHSLKKFPFKLTQSVQSFQIIWFVIQEYKIIEKNWLQSVCLSLTEWLTDDASYHASIWTRVQGLWVMGYSQVWHRVKTICAWEHLICFEVILESSFFISSKV